MMDTSTLYHITFQYLGMDPVIDRAVADGVDLAPTSKAFDFETHTRFLCWKVTGELLRDQVMRALGRVWHQHRVEWFDAQVQLMSRRLAD